MRAFRFEADSDLQTKLSGCADQIVLRHADEHLFSEGERSVGMYLIKKGALRLFLGRSGAECTVGVGALVGLPATINGHAYTLNCDVVEDAELAFISCNTLVRLMRTDTEVAIKLLSLLSTEVQSLRAVLSQPRRFRATRSKKPN